MLSINLKERNTKEWRNWSGLVRALPRSIVYPASIDEVVEVVKASASEGRKLRVVGTRHSFTRLVQTDDVLVSLDQLQGVIAVDSEKGIAEVWGGTKLDRLGEELHAFGVAQENLGDINAQSIAGAISTGTHGTGERLGSLATQAVGMTVVTAKGDILECSAEQDEELFRAVQVSLGMFGIIVKVKLRVVPSYALRYTSRKISFSQCLEQLDLFKKENRHFEFYWFPYTDVAQIKLTNKTNEVPGPPSRWSYWKVLLMENVLFWVLSECCRLIPRLCKPVSRLSAASVPDVQEVGYSHRIFATPRLVRFNELEYSVPADRMRIVLEEIREMVDCHQFAVHFPIECRYVQGDNLWLSPANGRDSAYIAVHMYRGMEYADYFAKVEEICRQHGGRPHWGKMHTMTADQLRSIYPKWDAFHRLRQELDPSGIFLNPYLAEMLQQGDEKMH
ncbi:FAD-binding protein [Paenibacillus sp. Marseille-P2973]|uniref:D-arabinono-1,4-lactone oxidase n=1 Tax=Paenibacillus sp. Marseille-P2973 TaxID=1871032 RepID=UPI001B36F2FE|nr:D-arabinono-1,4-lactone oxidase [Paenibacillus sp. Marseille-P2973]MBQ4897746.1 FAD-binding protein [Paenibacillus sp. Marseille-P2973]